MAERVYNVLFLCTGNSARSIMAESVLARDGAGRFRAYSAGSRPMGEVHPLALKVLSRSEYPVVGLRSKSWDEFAAADAPVMDMVITVCDNAAGESCPLWPGHPATAHWGIEDPTAVSGSEEECEAAFITAFRYLKNRVSLLLSLPMGSLDKLSLGTSLRMIGGAEGATHAARNMAD